MSRRKNDAALFESGKSRVPFVAGIAFLVVGFVFCRTLSVNGSETADASLIAQAASKPVRTPVRQEAAHTSESQPEIPPSVILQPHAQIKPSPPAQQNAPVRQHAVSPPQNNFLQPLQNFFAPHHQPPARPQQNIQQQNIQQQNTPAFSHTIMVPQPHVQPVSATRPQVKPEQQKGTSIQLVDETGKPVTPSAVVTQNGKFYFLGPKHLWVMEWTEATATEPRHAYLKKCHPPAAIDKIPVQEFNNMISVAPRKSLVILSKAGDLFEYFTETGAWHQYRANVWLTGSPDPDYVDLAFNGKDIILIDPERNEIWVCPPNSKYLSPYFREVMPWQVRRGDHYVGDGIGIAYDGLTYILRKSGTLTKYSGNSRANVRQMKFPYRAPGRARLRPSRLITAAGAPVYIVERENNRVLCIDKKTGQTSHFVFSRSADLRGLAPIKDGFAIVNGDTLVTRKFDTADAPAAELHPRRIDHRLEGIGIPVPGGCLPSHLGVFPGARRLYRYGIHAGVDFFNGAGNRVVMGTPALAAESGKITRLDRNFKDMDAATFNRVMSQCAREHNTSDHNEDLFRGCQVWIDHGNRMVTRYAHLDKINNGLKENAFVTRGEKIGYIGVSGTGQNLPGRAKYPHLHFEIWLDGHYVGYGLTPGETLGLYEDIFGTGR